LATPSSASQGEYINKTCTVTDNMEIDTVNVSITGPVGFTPVNVSMNEGSYYYNASYMIVGTYDYFIWVNDTSGNSNMSSVEHFTIFTPGAWWNSEWPYRKEIRIDHTKIDATLSNFPVLISTMDTDLQSKAQTNGDDIVFADYYETKLDHEIELFNSTSGELVCWVNITSLSSTEDTILYMYYGNPSCGSQEDVAGTWDSSFVGVWHLDDIADSSSKGHDGTNYGADNCTGKIGGGKDFYDDYIAVADHDDFSIDTTGDLTVETWVNFDDVNPSSTQLILTKGQQASNSWEWQYHHTSLASHGFRILSSGGGTIRFEDWVDGSPDRNADVWYHVTIVCTGATQNDDILIYVNGTEVSSFNSQAASSYTNGPSILQFGCGDAGGSWYYFDGQLDEIRMSNNQRNASWINTSFNNQNNPSSFMSVGS